MRRLAWILAAVAAAGAAVAAWLTLGQSRPPEVQVAELKRNSLVSQLDTNGKTEPAEWAPVHAAREGAVAELLVERGRAVTGGQPLLRLASPGVEAEIAAAEARLEQAKASLAVVDQGGRAVELAEIDGSLSKLRVERDSAMREETALDRLVSKQAATRAERDAARDRRLRLDAEIASLEQKRKALVVGADRTSAAAAVRSAEQALRLARERQAEAVVRAPLAGVVYQLEAKPAEWLSPGALVARIGRLDELRVWAYVDEPELGDVRLGQPVEVTWDAIPGKKWTGRVERLPTTIVAQGSRQVGEVLTRVSNSGGELPASANVNVRIRLRTVNDALPIPKEALRREGDETGAYVLAGDTLQWRRVETGASSVTHIEVRSGLKAGDRVVLGSEVPLKAGMRVTARN